MLVVHVMDGFFVCFPDELQLQKNFSLSISRMLFFQKKKSGCNFCLTKAVKVHFVNIRMTVIGCNFSRNKRESAVCSWATFFLGFCSFSGCNLCLEKTALKVYCVFFRLFFIFNIM